VKFVCFLQGDGTRGKESGLFCALKILAQFNGASESEQKGCAATVFTDFVTLFIKECHVVVLMVSNNVDILLNKKKSL